MATMQSQAQSSRTSPTETSDRIVKLYPNPATTYITFDLQNSYKKGLSIQIFNGLLGKKMYETQNVPSKFNIDLNEFNRGIYVYHLVDATGNIIESGKFQVSR